MKDTFYFTHDYNAATDEKIIKLLSRHGMAGYGVFWRIIESLYNNTNVLKTDYDRIAYDLHTSDVNLVRSVINDFDLFQFDGDCFGSASIEKRLIARDIKSQKARESVLQRWNKVKPEEGKDTSVLKTDTFVSESDTIKERKGNKGKEIKEIVFPNAFSIGYTPVNGYDSLAYKLWKLCYDSRVEKNIKPTLLEKAKPHAWTNSMRLMIERDNRTESEITEIIDSLKKDPFWINNIQSPDNLRKHFETLQLQMKSKRTSKRPGLPAQQLSEMDYTAKA